VEIAFVVLGFRFRTEFRTVPVQHVQHQTSHLPQPKMCFVFIILLSFVLVTSRFQLEFGNGTCSGGVDFNQTVIVSDSFCNPLSTNLTYYFNGTFAVETLFDQCDERRQLGLLNSTVCSFDSTSIWNYTACLESPESQRVIYLSCLSSLSPRPTRGPTTFSPTAQAEPGLPFHTLFLLAMFAIIFLFLFRRSINNYFWPERNNIRAVTRPDAAVVRPEGNDRSPPTWYASWLTQQDEAVHGGDLTVCLICEDRPTTWKLPTCGHLMCKPCLTQVLNRTGECPFDRIPIEHVPLRPEAKDLENWNANRTNVAEMKALGDSYT
jgi:hypothetical protein